MDFDTIDEAGKLDPRDLDSLAEKLVPYDSADLLAAIAGLQLLPENADRAIRLEVFAHVAASLEDEPDKPNISLQRLKQFASTEPLGKGFIPAQEDPCDNAMTEAFTYNGGTFIVFPGNVDESSFILRHIALAVLSHSDAYPKDFVHRVDRLFTAVLALSHEIARRAGLGRAVMPVFLGREGEVLVPDSRRLTQLKQAVSFRHDELRSILSSWHLPSETLDRLIIPIGGVSLTDFQLDKGDLQVRPIVQVGKRVIIAIPSMLLVAMRHEVIRLAFEHGIQGELAKNYTAAIWHTVVQSLGYLGNISLPLSPPAFSIPCCRSGFFNLDTDKLIYAVLVTDALEGYDLHHAFGTWLIEQARAEIEKHLQIAQEHILSMSSPPREILFLVVTQQIGRSVFMQYQRLETSTSSFQLSLTAADLETIAFLEGGEQLTLWKYARLSWQAREQAHIIAMGELNEFFLYRKYGYSYFIPEKERPSIISMLPGGAGELRQEVIRLYDPHAVVSYLPGYVIDVVALHDTATVPLYAPLRPHDNRIACLVEGLPLPLWITGQQSDASDQPDIQDFSQHIVHAIAYWLWQCTPPLSPLLQPLVAHFHTLRVECSLRSMEAQHQDEGQETAGTEQLLSSAVDTAQGVLSITFDPSSLQPLFATADNSGERLVMDYVLKGLREFLPNAQQDKLSDAVIQSILDQYAPRGFKKMLMYNMLNDTPELDPRNLPSYRKVQEADEHELLDELGGYLRTVKHLKPGPVSEDQRITILNTAVEYYYQELVTLVASLQPQDLLEFCITLQEATTRESSYRELTIPTQLACFSSEPEMVEKLSNELPELATAATAGRFLIEYIAACPPQGTRPISLSVYDRLLALASHIIAFGQTSDLLHAHIADMTIELLPSDRLYFDRQQYGKALELYLPAMAASQIDYATEAFVQRWQEEEKTVGDTAQQEILTQMEAAAQAEFGCPLSDIQKFMAGAFVISEELDPACACLPRDEFVERLAEYLGWSSMQVNHVLTLVTLSPHPDFLHPPSPYRAEDVYPWRYNRQLSYVRRPFISRVSDETNEILWGNRHLSRAAHYLLDLCFTGRLQTHSPQMRKLMGSILHKKGEAFNDRVADILNQNPDLIVRTRVKKIGRLQPPGDIDILIADPKKRRLGILECKDFTLARTPHELDNELKKLFEGKHGNKSMIEQRAAWVSAHTEEILHWLLGDRAGKIKKWRVEPLIITSQELLSPYLKKSPIRVVSLAKLLKEKVW